MVRSSRGSTQNTSHDESTQEESKSSKLYRTLLISGIIKKPGLNIGGDHIGIIHFFRTTSWNQLQQ